VKAGELVVTVDSQKVNRLLRGFQRLLEEYHPNLQELVLVNSRINALTARNLTSAASRVQRKSSETGKKPSSEKWVKIPVE